MKENRIYYNLKSTTCQRIIRALGDETLTLNEIMVNLRNQINRRGKPYGRIPSVGKVKQIVSKYPIFKNVGTTVGQSGVGHNTLVNKYKYTGE